MDKSSLNTAWIPPHCKRVLFVVLLVLICAVTVSWRFFEIDQWAEPHTFGKFIQSLRASSLAPLMVVIIYVMGGLVVFPVFLLITLTAFAFGPVLGGCYSLMGLFANATVLYAIGHHMGHKSIRNFPGTRTYHLSQQLSRHSWLTMATLRFLPLAPFTVISLIAGASHITYRKYIAGTLLGISPSLVIMTLAGNHLQRTVSDPGSQNLIIVILGGTVLLLVALWLKQLKAIR